MTTNRDSVGEIHAYNLDVKNREIYINEFDDSGESAGVDHRMLQNFIKNINILKNLSKDPITIHMQTVGGCWYSGMGIYDAIRSCKCKTTFIGYGQLCSMGTVIIQASSIFFSLFIYKFHRQTRNRQLRLLSYTSRHLLVFFLCTI